MDCELFLNRISARLDGELPAEERAELAAHLAECPACRAADEAFALQHEELRAAFGARRQATRATAAEVNARLEGSARTRTARENGHEKVPIWQRAALALGVLATAACLAFVFRSWLTPTPRVEPNPRPQPMADRGYRLTPRARAEGPKPTRLAVGDALETKAGERRRVTLPDGSVLFVNESTRVRLDGERQVSLLAGQVFVEAEQAPARDDRAKFVVKSGAGEVVALGTKFEVRRGQSGDRVLVTQGKVQVGDKVVRAGQQLDLAGGDREPEPLPRASHVLDWTRDLMAAAETPLVPGSEFAGGALVAVDSSGQEAKLTLRKYHVDVHIEDGFARTTIDQTYFNHHPWRLEGTFYFPLPPDASLSRLAMYVNGQLMEGGMAEREYAAAVYQQIVSSQKDPALLEWVDGSTFKMRVFPLEGRQEKRILLSYTQRLHTLYGQTQYRFPAGHNLQVVRDWSFKGRVKGGATLQAESPTHPTMRVDRDGEDLLLNAEENLARVDRDVVVNLAQEAGAVDTAERIRFGSADHEGRRYLMLRYRPQLDTEARRERRDWVFLYESSADRNPLLARVQIDVIRHLLFHAEHDDTFTILTAGTNVRRFPEEPLPATPENVLEGLNFLEGTHLIGALDLGRAFTEAAEVLKDSANPYLVHLGSGLTAMGRPQEELKSLLPRKARYIGVGVGKHWGRSSMKEWAKQTGGYFTQINPDESVAWRSFDLLSTLNTPRLLDVRVEGVWADDVPPDERALFLADMDSVCQGEELFAVARLAKSERTGAAVLPLALLVSGTLDGKAYERRIDVAEVAGGKDYLPRIWAKQEIDRLLAKDDGRLKDEIVELSKAMYVMTPYTSLLVLENEEMYERFKVDRGRKDHWALYPAPEKIPVVYEPDPNQPVDVRNAPQGLKPAPGQVRGTIRTRGYPNVLGGGVRGSVRFDHEAEDGLAGLKANRSLADLSLGNVEGLPADFAQPAFSKMPALYKDFRRKGLLEAEKAVRGRPSRDRFTGTSGRGGRDGGEVEFQLANGTVMFDIPTAGVTPLFRTLSEGRWNRGEANGRLGDFYSHNFMRGIQGGQGGLPGTPALGEPLRQVNWHLESLSDSPAMTPPLTAGLRFQPVREAIAGKRLRLAAGESLARLKKVADKDADRTEAWDGEQAYLVQALQHRLDQGTALPAALYDRPSFSGDGRLFSDLTLYAPGLNTSPADIEAVLADEAMPQLRDAPGTIDPEARKLFDRARAGGWSVLSLSADKKEGVSFLLDAAGRHAYERVLANGLRERVICDGKSLWHLYPQLGLGARRAMSRFHRASLYQLVPWLCPVPEDLARGADVKFIDDRTVAVVPHRPEEKQGKEPTAHIEVRLIFSSEGSLSERRIVLMPENETLFREVYDGQGGVKVFGDEGKELATLTQEVKPAQAPDLAPDLSALVVLPLPFRSRQHVYPQLLLEPGRSLADEQNGCFEYVEPDEALALLSTALGENNGGEARLIVERCFHTRDDSRPGFYTVLRACGVDLDGEPAFQEALAKQPAQPLFRHLALESNGVYNYLQRRLPINLGATVRDEEGFFARLARAHDIFVRWQKYPSRWIRRTVRRKDVAEVTAFARANPHLPLAWGLLAHVEGQGGIEAASYQVLADAWGFLAEKNGEAYTARYEEARCLYSAGKGEEARRRFVALHEKARKEGWLPAVDSQFRYILQGSGKEEDLWSPLMREMADHVLAKGDRPTAMVLAWQAQQLGDVPLADSLYRLAMDGVEKDKDRLGGILAGFAFLWQTDRTAEAEQWIAGLLAEERFARSPELWRLGSRLASRRGMTALAVTRLERALDMEYADLPDVIPLQNWRNDYSTLLSHYENLAGALEPLGTRAPADLALRTIRAVDRWRAHEAEDSQKANACQWAARILDSLGMEDLAWEYRTTAVGSHPGQSGPWLNLARSLSREGKQGLATRAYEAASEAESQNALIVWEQARHFRDTGQEGRSQRLLKRLTQEEWPEDYRGIGQRARWLLAE